RLHGGDLQGSGTLEFTSADYYADENSTNALITIRRRGGTGAPSGDVYVDFATSNLTAVANVNYKAVNTNLYFGVGETFASVLVPVLSDGLISGDKTVHLELSNATGDAAVTNQPVATLTIFDDDC